MGEAGLGLLVHSSPLHLRRQRPGIDSHPSGKIWVRGCRRLGASAGTLPCYSVSAYGVRAALFLAFLATRHWANSGRLSGKGILRRLRLMSSPGRGGATPRRSAQCHAG